MKLTLKKSLLISIQSYKNLKLLSIIHLFIPQVVLSPTSHQTSHQNHRIKVPQIDIEKFSSDVTEWQTFFDSFEFAVHSNNKLSNIKKMNYFISYLTGEALNNTQDLKLSEPNHSVASKCHRSVTRINKFKPQ